MMKKLFLYIAMLGATPLFAANMTVTKTAEDLGTQYNWSAGGFYGTFQLDKVVTIAANQPDSGSLNGYYSADDPRDWRIYQARNHGEFTVSSRSGYRIKTIRFVYSTTNNGVLSLDSGLNISQNRQVLSEQVLTVDSTSITFYAGNTGTGLKGQVRISQFEVTYNYADTTALLESFMQVDQEKNNDDEVTWQGDVMDWKVLHGRRAAKDTLNGGVQGTWTKSDGYIKATESKGGIKRLHFEWRQFVTEAVELKLAIAAGDVWKDTARMQSIAAQAESVNHLYDTLLQCKQDAPLAFYNISPESATGKDRFLLGDFYITPYIYVPEHSRNLKVKQQQEQFDLSSILMDNTDGEGEIVYSIVDDQTLGATISGSVVDFTQSQVSGVVQVCATWNNGKVSTHIVSLNVAVVEKGEFFTETFSSCNKTKFTTTTYVVGDHGVYGWNLTHFARKESDTIMGQQATLVGYNGGIAMNGAQEGGIKSIQFNWCAKQAAQPVHFVVSVDGEPTDYTYTIAQSKGEVHQFKDSYDIPYNTAMSFTIGAKESTAQAEIWVSPIEIMPYLLFRNKLDTLQLNEATTYNLDSAIINNTHMDASYTILSDETGVASILDGKLDLSAVTTSGKVKVQATWGQVTTTMTIFAHKAATGLINPECKLQNSKLFINGQLIINHAGQQYNAQGARL